MDDEWGVGSYEDTARELEPASEVAVAGLGVTAGDRVLDVACGTGNAALVAARTGAQVTGLDGSQRLVEVARERVPGAEFVVGDATAMPFEDGQFDAAVSVFGVILVRPAEKAAAELARVVRPGGRIAITSWLPLGPVFEAITLMRQAIERVRPAEGPPPVNWSDPAMLEELLGGHGEMEVSEHELPQDGTAPEEIWDRWERLHPMWIGARRLLEPAGEWEGLREGSIAALSAGAARDAALSHYILVVLDRR